MALVPTTWNPSDKSASVTLSNGNLTATSATQGVGVRSIFSATTGKFYWEITSTAAGAAPFCGLADPSVSLISGILSTTPKTALAFFASGNIYVNGVLLGTFTGWNGTTATVVSFAVDVGAKLLWVRTAPAGNWNNSGTADPATGVGGISLSTAAMSATFALWVSSAVSSNAATANFGATAFAGTVPSGFNAGFGTVAPTTMQATQLALEEWAKAPTPSMQATQLAIEQWAAVQTANPYMVATQLALEEWASVAVASAAAAQARAMIMA